MEMLNKKMGGAFAFKKEANMNVQKNPCNLSFYQQGKKKQKKKKLVAKRVIKLSI